MQSLKKIHAWAQMQDPLSAIYWVVIVSNKPALIGEYAFSQMEFIG